MKFMKNREKLNMETKHGVMAGGRTAVMNGANRCLKRVISIVLMVALILTTPGLVPDINLSGGVAQEVSADDRTVSLDKLTYEYGDIPYVYVTGTVGSDDWVGIYENGKTPSTGDSIWYIYASEVNGLSNRKYIDSNGVAQGNGSNYKGKLPIGTYTIWYMDTDVKPYKTVFHRTFEVISSYNFSVSDENGDGTFDCGEAINISLNYPYFYNETEWIGLYKRDATVADKQSLYWYHLSWVSAKKTNILGSSDYRSNKWTEFGPGDYKIILFTSYGFDSQEETRYITVGQNHRYNFSTTITDSTCSATGKKIETCYCFKERETTIAKKAHTEVTDAAVSATCTTAGKTAGKHCSVCNTVITAQTTIPATGHTEVTDAAVSATCTTAGKTAGKHCSVCNTVITAQTTIPATGHTEVIDKAVAATCTTTGLTEGKHCSVCNTVIKKQEVVSALGHSYQYRAVENVLYETCANNCDHNASLTLEPLTQAQEKEPGKPVTPQMTQTPAGNWQGGTLPVAFVNNNVADGTATVSISKDDATASTSFEIYSTYTVTLHLNEGNIGGENPITYNRFSDNFSLPMPEKSGYDFSGWTGEGITEPTKNVEITKGSTGNKVYTAVWQADSCQLDVEVSIASDAAIRPAHGTPVAILKLQGEQNTYYRAVEFDLSLFDSVAIFLGAESVGTTVSFKDLQPGMYTLTQVDTYRYGEVAESTTIPEGEFKLTGGTKVYTVTNTVDQHQWFGYNAVQGAIKLSKEN